MSILKYFEQQLLKITQLSFHSQSFEGSKMNWDGQAKADVTASKKGKTIYLDEKGYFLGTASKKPVFFQNKFKLIFEANYVAFSHERFGAEQSVFLFDLIPSPFSQNELQSRNAHQCASDFYRVNVKIQSQQILMNWQIQGKRKNEQIHYCYFV